MQTKASKKKTGQSTIGENWATYKIGVFSSHASNIPGSPVDCIVLHADEMTIEEVEIFNNNTGGTNIYKKIIIWTK